MSRRLISFVAAAAVAAGTCIAGASAADAAVTPSLTIKTNHNSYSAGQIATVSVHLGVGGGKQHVKLYGRLPRHSGVYLRTLQPNTSGNAIAHVRLLHNETLTAHYLGSAGGGYGARTVSTRLLAVKERIAGHFSGGYASSGIFHFVHRAKHAVLEAAVAPAKGGERIYFPLQVYYGGAWHTKLNHSYKLTNHNVDGGTISTTGVSFHYTAGYRVRIRAGYHGDYLNIGTYTKWVHVKFV